MLNWQKFWQKKGLGNFLLLPLSAVFYGLSTLRRKAYQLGWLKSQKATLPVVVVGNINVGGAGKTPLVIALGRLLAEHKIPYAVISKGYGGSYHKPTVVSRDDSAAVVGDEPLLIKLKCDCPVVVAKSRIEATQLVAQKFPEVSVILTDDGLQNYALKRDVEICVINEKMGLGNGWVLPAGGLREPPSQLENVDFVVYNGGSPQRDYRYMLAERGWYHINTGKQRYHDEFSTNSTQNLAISGIAHPDLFFQRLDDLGIAAETKSLPDHYAITAADLPADKTLLMTEKDWVKAKQFNHQDAWYLSVEAILSEAFKVDFLTRIRQLVIVK